MKKNRLLEYFGLNSYDEIMTYIRENPEDEKVKEIKELFETYSTDLDREVDRNENNLYKEFNCSSKEELYENKRQDDEIKPLLEFLDYAKSNIKNNKKKQ